MVINGHEGRDEHLCDAVTRGTQQSEIPFWDLRAWTMGGHRQDRILYFPATKVN